MDGERGDCGGGTLGYPGTVRAARATAVASTAAMVLAAACGAGGMAGQPPPADRRGPPDAADPGRLRARIDPARPRGPARESRRGVQRLTTAGGGEALLYVPGARADDRAAPLAVLMHGAGGRAASGLAVLQDLADEAGLVLLAPSSRGSTWDLLRGGYGSDATTIDALLEVVFRRLDIDPDRVALGGFSDGASYALSLGTANGDLFTHLIAFSPGFVARGDPRGRPAVYVSHGVDDRVLPIAHCSRRIVPSLRSRGYEVHYREFDGGHTVPPELAREAVGWLVSSEGP